MRRGIRGSVEGLGQISCLDLSRKWREGGWGGFLCGRIDLHRACFAAVNGSSVVALFGGIDQFLHTSSWPDMSCISKQTLSANAPLVTELRTLPSLKRSLALWVRDLPRTDRVQCKRYLRLVYHLCILIGSMLEGVIYYGLK